MNALNWPKPRNRSPRRRDGEKIEAGPGRIRNAKHQQATRARAAMLVGGLTTVAAIYLLTVKLSGDGGTSVTTELPRPQNATVMGLPPPNLLRPMSTEEAAKLNAERPFVNRPDTPAGRFVLKTDSEDRARALNCLTQAIYYEAASEGADGGRAVAQVVLNRMHHPGYPSTICGVVYQGAERGNGCQFTFTCDGSLLRAPLTALWTRSRKIAEDALGGKVFAPIGHATHYHADYVLPYWADSLDKTVQIGRHIFYRLRNSLGDSRAFSQRYAGTEPTLSAPVSPTIIPPEMVTPQVANALLSDQTSGIPKEVEKAAPGPNSALLIDSSKGSLLADFGVTSDPKHKAERLVDCTAISDRKKVKPLSANDVHVGSVAPSC